MTNFAEITPWGTTAHAAEKDFMSVNEVLDNAKLNYKVELQDCFLPNGARVPKTKIAVRTDLPDAQGYMGTVGERYTCLQNQEAFAWMQEFVDAGVATIEHAGSLKLGQLVFMQAKVASVQPIEIIKGDAIESYITLLNSFDGSTSVFAGFFPRRIFCQNQLPALKSSKMLKLKHTKNVTIGLDKIREIMDVHTQEFLATTEQYKFLASKGVNKKDLEKYVRLLFKKDENDEAEMRESRIEEIQYLFESGRGASELTHNYYGAFNAINEHLNYNAGRGVDTRLESLWKGVNASVNQRAFDVALQLAHEK